MVRVWILAVLGFGAVVSVTSLQAEAADKEPAVTRRTEVDEDFAFQGEYSGTLSADVETNGGPSREAGLQVIALGNQQFTGVLLPDGLPGNGGDGKTHSILNGERSGSMLTLRSEGLQIEIQNGVAKVVDANAKVSGHLSHVLRTSKREGAPPPPNSYILFDGRGPGAFHDGKMVDGLLQCGTDLIPLYQDYLMHVEFLVPYMPASNSQARGNSGVYLQSRYEIQILDTFGREGLANECGGIYKQRAPRLNMAFPPLSWQTYDITFRSPRFDSQGRKIQNARLTLLHNGVKVHDNVDILDKTGAGQPEAPHLLPIKLQDHGNPVQFRNIWLVNLR